VRGGVIGERAASPLPTSYGAGRSAVTSQSGFWGGALTEIEFGAFWLKNLASVDYKLLICNV